MGVKYLRYPGGDKSDLNLFSVPPYERSAPTLARTGKWENIILEAKTWGLEPPKITVKTK